MTDYAKSISRYYRRIAKPVRTPSTAELTELFNYMKGPYKRVLHTLERSYIAVFDNFLPNAPELGGKAMVVLAPDATGMWDFYIWPDGGLELRDSRTVIIDDTWMQGVLPAPGPFARNRSLPEDHTIIKPVRTPSEQEVLDLFNIIVRDTDCHPLREQIQGLKACYIAVFENFVPHMPKLNGKGMILVAPDNSGQCQLFVWKEGELRFWASPKALERQLAMGRWNGSLDDLD